MNPSGRNHLLSGSQPLFCPYICDSSPGREQTVRHPSKAGIEIQGRFILFFQDLEGFFRCCSILLSRILQESPGERVSQRRAPAGAYVERNPLFCVWQRTGYLSAYQFAHSTADVWLHRTGGFWGLNILATCISSLRRVAENRAANGARHATMRQGVRGRASRDPLACIGYARVAPGGLFRVASGIWHVTMHPSETGGRGVDPRSGPRHATILGG